MDIDLWLEKALEKVKSTDPEELLAQLKSYGLVKPKSNWIKCSERMPEETEIFGGDDFSPDVLVIDQYEDIFVACTHWGKWIRLKHEDCIISHWQPLPSPPESD